MGKNIARITNPLWSDLGDSPGPAQVSVPNAAWYFGHGIIINGIGNLSFERYECFKFKQILLYQYLGYDQSPRWNFGFCIQTLKIEISARGLIVG